MVCYIIIIIIEYCDTVINAKGFIHKCVSLVSVRLVPAPLSATINETLFNIVIKYK